ncbi:radical SAM protein [Lentzea sp. NBRC 102530]|uniref:radical SAM protein n=1 Tax=Lentzea sp. NBRC 102530 TaxID=3032201 RepID=UPI0024A4A2F3|nr:radical SAM protein [Lentzea sp. NBRC 102530]GLY50574.1 hypothetical protein Lesp01_42300 [Lentzea sp. NBRC 102530]
MKNGAYPHNVQLIVTERCNLACRHCAVPEEDSPAGTELTIDDWKAFTTLLDGAGVRSLTISGGEALLRHGVMDLTEHACALRFDQVCLVSNGLVMREPDRVAVARLQRQSHAFGYHVSLDGASARTHDWMRGQGAWARTWRNLERLRAAGGRVDGVQVVLHEGNADELEQLAHQARELGSRVVVVFPHAAIGRARRTPHGLTPDGWSEVYRRTAALEAATGLSIVLMGPVLIDEWPDSASVVPNPATPTSMNMCVGPDGEAFTCPPLRPRSLGAVGDLLSGADSFDAVAARGGLLTHEVCGTCKFQLLCTGVNRAQPWRDRAAGQVFRDPHVVA